VDHLHRRDGLGSAGRRADCRRGTGNRLTPIAITRREEEGGYG
jgi:hypothetical protein